MRVTSVCMTAVSGPPPPPSVSVSASGLAGEPGRCSWTPTLTTCHSHQSWWDEIPLKGEMLLECAQRKLFECFTSGKGM